MSFFSALRRVIDAIRTRSEHLDAISQLRAMSDRELQDIGIHRSQSEDMVFGRLIRGEVDPALVRPRPAANRRSGPLFQAPANAA